MYGIYEDNNTDSSSLLFTSINFSRVSAPICFNYLGIINYKKSAFNHVLGDIDLVPVLGSSITTIFPLLLLTFFLFNFFDIHERILNLLGYK